MIPEKSGAEGTRAKAAGVERVGPPRHNPLLARFYHAAWGRESTADEIAESRRREAEANPVEPGVEPPRWLFILDGRAIGHLGTIPVRFRVDGGVPSASDAPTEFESYWFKGFWVLPEYRAGPVGHALLEAAIRELGPVAVSTTAVQARRLFESLGLEEIGVLYNRVLLLRPGRVLRHFDPERIPLEGLPWPAKAGLRLVRALHATRLAGGLVRLASGALRAVHGGAARGVTVIEDWSAISASDLDTVWEESRDTIGNAAVRDGRTLLWRYSAADGYRMALVHEGGRPVAWAVITEPGRSSDDRLEGLSVASLSDILFPANRADLGLAAVSAAHRVAEREGADALLCSGTHPVLDRVLADHGFLSIPGNVHFMARDVDETAFPRILGRWWLTRGDAGSDGAF